MGNSLGGLRFGVDAEGNYGYKKAGADTVIPFKKIEEFNMFGLYSMMNNTYYFILPASLFKNYKIVFPSRYGSGNLQIYGIKGEYDFSKVQYPSEIPLDKTLIQTVGMSDTSIALELPEEYDCFAFWYDWNASIYKYGIEFKFIPK